MKNDCEIVRDLLPAYMDHLCSDASKEYIEEHIAVCSECKKILEEATQDEQPGAISEKLPDAEKILREASWKLHIKAILSALGITAIVVFWLVYLWAKIFADQGSYRYFSWPFWEALSAGVLILPMLTVVWIAVLAVRSIRKKTWKKNAVLVLILVLLAGAQFGYRHGQTQIAHMTQWTTVEDIPDAFHIVIRNTDGAENATTKLETNPTVAHLVKTDGTIYGFVYECRKENLSEGVLLGVWDTVE